MGISKIYLRESIIDVSAIACSEIIDTPDTMSIGGNSIRYYF